MESTVAAAPAQAVLPAPTPLAPPRPATSLTRGARTWVYPDRDPERARELARATRVSPLLAELLIRRGIGTADEVKAFLDPALTQLHDPSLLPDMDRAVDRLEVAIAERHPVLLYSDYDVDGTTGAAILHEILSRLGAVVSVHVPDRIKDGYGLKVDRLRRARDEGVRVVVSIDNGVAALDEAKFCREVGLDLIVTDHHTLKHELPQAVAVVHPRVPGSRYPNPHICGAGVAFKLAWAIAQRISARRSGGGTTIAPGKILPELRERLLCGLGLVALGTIADVVALKGENRAFVRHGLKVLALGPTPGLRALLGVCDSGEKKKDDSRPIDSTFVAFQVAPRLNAAGRMGDAGRAFRLLTAANDVEAHALAAELDRENERRRGVQKDTVAAARAEVERLYGASDRALEDSTAAPTPAPESVRPEADGIVVAGEEWPLGVVGIVAAKLVEDLHRPVLCLTVMGDVAKGSGRSVPEVDVLRCLERCREYLETFGGHAAACGLSVKRDRLEAFRRAFSAAVLEERAAARTAPVVPAAAPSVPEGAPASSPDGEAAHAAGARPSQAKNVGPRLEIDLEVALRDVSPSLLTELDLLEPFGQGNRPPLLAVRDLELAGEPRPMGRDGDHCAFFVRQGDSVLRTVAFGRRDLLEALRARALDRTRPGRFDLAFRPKINRWNGTTSVELECEELRFTP